MSLFVDVESITEVLLVDGWHTVLSGTFVIDAYEFGYHRPEGQKTRTEDILHGGGESGICSKGFRFEEISDEYEQIDLGYIAGPLNAVQAVRWRRP